MRKARQVLRNNDRVVDFERMIDDVRSEGPGLLASLNMLLVTTGGFDFSPSNCNSWLQPSGFAAERTAPLLGMMTMVVGRAI